jgi:polyphosphate kinase
MANTIGRDVSQIEFYRRVFDEARDEANPLLERVKFLSILGTIVEEFAVAQRAVAPEIATLLDQARSHWRDTLVPALAACGIHLLPYSDLSSDERAVACAYFNDSVLPVLMPLGFDAARPFPHLSGRCIALAVALRTQGEDRFACVEIPKGIPALVPLHRRGEPAYVWLHDVVAENLDALFPAAAICSSHPFKILRDTSIDATPVDGGTLRDAVEIGVLRREFGDVVALTVTDTMPTALVELLATGLGVGSDAVRRCSDSLDLSMLDELSRLEKPELRNAPLAPRSRSGRLFDDIRQGDILLHHPFDSFHTVTDFIEQAATDPDVLAISTTIYRAGRHSPIVPALLRAQRAGKQVRAVIELRARFDETNNLAWGYALEQAGVHVVYGTVNFKVHAKTTLIVRREAGRLRRYVHLSSGNYNPATATAYTDIGLFTCREDVGHDATQIFNVISGYGAPRAFRSLLVAPLTLRQRVTELIEREARWATEGHRAHIILKMNALSDADLIECLYRASQAGVQIDLIVRGICCLRPGVPTLSDNIRVRSIVGRFLEHSRAWYFHNGGHEQIYVGSADLMTRNLDDRVEIMVPIEDEALKQRVRQDILGTYLADNVKARELCPDGQYVRVSRKGGDTAVNSQECFQ